MLMFSLQDSSDNDEDVGVTIEWANHCFRDFVKHHYGGNRFGEDLILVVSNAYLLSLWNQMP